MGKEGSRFIIVQCNGSGYRRQDNIKIYAKLKTNKKFDLFFKSNGHSQYERTQLSPDKGDEFVMGYGEGQAMECLITNGDVLYSLK